MAAGPAIARVVLVEHLRAGALGSATLGLRELLRHSQILFLIPTKKFGDLSLDCVFSFSLGHFTGVSAGCGMVNHVNDSIYYNLNDSGLLFSN